MPIVGNAIASFHWTKVQYIRRIETTRFELV
jgi:hypothetical protein